MAHSYWCLDSHSVATGALWHIVRTRWTVAANWSPASLCFKQRIPCIFEAGRGGFLYWRLVFIDVLLCRFIQLDVDYHEGLMTNCIAEQLIAAAASSAKHCPWLVLICFELFRSLCQVVSEVGIITNGVGVIIIRCHLSTFGIRILFHQRHFIEIAEMFGDVWSRTRSMSIHESSWTFAYPCFEGSMSFHHFSCIIFSWSFTTPSSSLNAARNMGI